MLQTISQCNAIRIENRLVHERILKTVMQKSNCAGPIGVCGVVGLVRNDYMAKDAKLFQELCCF